MGMTKKPFTTYGFGGMRLKAKARDSRGQMTAELCVILPIALIVAVIAINAMVFMSECAQFDRVSRNAVRAIAASPVHGNDTSLLAGRVCEEIEAAFDEPNVSCSVSASQIGTQVVKYSMTLEYSPTLFGLGLKTEIFGVPLPKLSHTSELSVNPYNPGLLMGLV